MLPNGGVVRGAAPWCFNLHHDSRETHGQTFGQAICDGRTINTKYI